MKKLSEWLRNRTIRSNGTELDIKDSVAYSYSIESILRDEAIVARVDEEWRLANDEFSNLYDLMPVKYMSRSELTFHSYVKLLAYLCIATDRIIGDVVEIGVWKGMSLSLMQRFCNNNTKVIGIDPFEIEGQLEEVNYFHKQIFPKCALVKGYSEKSIERAFQLSSKFRILHIDGGHSSANVWADFLLYERFLVPGGYVVFDDYSDFAHSPDVAPAVDRLREAGLFKDYEIKGQIDGFEGSYVLRKTA